MSISSYILISYALFAIIMLYRIYKSNIALS
jgi:hypothetical protein